jgi:hypothetical protein
MKAQTNQQKRGIHLSVQRQRMNQAAEEYWGEQQRKKEIRDLGNRAFLSSVQYQRVFDLWVRKSGRLDSDRDEANNNNWRKDLTNKLNQPDLTRLIEEGIQRPTKDERENLRDLLIECKGNPLMFLNLCGVQPFCVLKALEGLEWGRKLYNATDDKLRCDYAKLIKYMDYLARSFDTLGPQLQQCLDDVNRKARIEETRTGNGLPATYRSFAAPEIFTPSDHLRVYKAILENRDDFIWLPRVHQRGGQTARFLNGLIYQLYETCLGQLRQRREGRFNPGEQLNAKATETALRSIDGVIAAIAYAVFPHAFHIRGSFQKGQLSDALVQRILRAVRHTYKKSEKYLLNTKSLARN